MAVFYDTGGGDIYGGPDKESILKAMREDIAPDDFVEEDVFEVPGTQKMRVTDENEEPTEQLITLAEEYTEALGSYCVASENC